MLTMLQRLNLILLGMATLLLLVCENASASEKPSSALIEKQTESAIKSNDMAKIPTSSTLTSSTVTEFITVKWTDLMPKEDLDVLLNPPSYVTDIEDGSFEDQISNQIQNTLAEANDDRYQQALNSTGIIPEMNGKGIRIPGFIVPLEFDDEQTITQFFLVPFFGACIHVPPPPPNQIIFVNYPQGLKLKALYDPFWVKGILKTSLIKNDMATAAYSMDMQTYEAYTE